MNFKANTHDTAGCCTSIGWSEGSESTSTASVIEVNDALPRGTQTGGPRQCAELTEPTAMAIPVSTNDDSERWQIVRRCFRWGGLRERHDDCRDNQKRKSNAAALWFSHKGTR